jgi:hypothetical protein
MSVDDFEIGLTGEEHLINILKLISDDDFDEEIMAKIFDYVEHHKLIDIPLPKQILPRMAPINEIISNTVIEKSPTGSIYLYKITEGKEE